MLSFILIQNRQYVYHPLFPTTIRLVCPTNQTPRGKTRLAKWYVPYSDDEKIKLKGEVCHTHPSLLFPPQHPHPPSSNLCYVCTCRSTA
jgi:hypothetical protein